MRLLRPPPSRCRWTRAGRWRARSPAITGRTRAISVSGSMRTWPGPRQFAADIDDVRAFLRKAQAMGDRFLGIGQHTAIGEGIGGDVDDAHQERRPSRASLRPSGKVSARLMGPSAVAERRLYTAAAAGPTESAMAFDGDSRQPCMSPVMTPLTLPHRLILDPPWRDRLESRGPVAGLAGYSAERARPRAGCRDRRPAARHRAALGGARLRQFADAALARDDGDPADAGSASSQQAYRVDDRLRELTFGRWEGFTWRDIRKSERELAQARERDKWGFVPPEGESYRMLAERIRPVFAGLAARDRGRQPWRRGSRRHGAHRRSFATEGCSGRYLAGEDSGAFGGQGGVGVRR